MGARSTPQALAPIVRAAYGERGGNPPVVIGYPP
jgi:hypothetical protein